MNDYNQFNNQNSNSNVTNTNQFSGNNVNSNQYNENNVNANQYNGMNNIGQGVYSTGNDTNNNKSTDKKVVIIVVCIILIILALLVILIANLGSKPDNTPTITTTTTTTKKVQESKELIDEISNISVKLNSEEYFDKILVVNPVQSVRIENVLAVYDINLVDENNSIVKVENTNLIISIPYDNVNKYTDFKVLYLDENNEVLETLNANYQNGKVVFEVNHLSRYAIVGTKVEEQTTKPTTTRPTTVQPTTTQKPNTTEATTQKPNTTKTETQKPSTTKKTTQKTNTTKPSTTKSTTTKSTTTKVTTTKSFNKYIVKFNSNLGTTVPNQTVIEGNKIIKPENPKRENYVFVEWQLNGTSYDFNRTVNQDLVLNAVWKYKLYQIKLNSGAVHPDYLWQYSFSREDIVDVTVTHESIPGLNGGGYSVYTFNGINPGVVTVTFNNNVDTKIYILNVDSDLVVTDIS